MIASLSQAQKVIHRFCQKNKPNLTRPVMETKQKKQRLILHLHVNIKNRLSRPDRNKASATFQRSLSFSLSHSFSLFLPFFLFLTLSAPLHRSSLSFTPPFPSLSLTFFLTHSLSLYLCQYNTISLPLSPLSLSVSLCHSLFLLITLPSTLLSLSFFLGDRIERRSAFEKDPSWRWKGQTNKLGTIRANYF